MNHTVSKKVILCVERW